MTMPNHWNSPEWWLPTLLLIAIAVPFILWSDGSRRVSLPIKVVLVTTKLGALGLLGICLLEPMVRYTQPTPGANSMILLVDKSQSLNVKDPGDSDARAERFRRLLDQNQSWLRKLEADFNLRRYEFDAQLSPIADFQDFRADGIGSRLGDALRQIAQRYDARPTAGIVVLTDGNVREETVNGDDPVAQRLSDPEALKLASAVNPGVPVYPVVIGSRRPLRDIAVNRVESSQSNFESSPVTINAEGVAYGFAGRTIVVELLGADNKPIEVQEIVAPEEGVPFAVRFQLKPADRGINPFQVRAYAPRSPRNRSFPDAAMREATWVNNQRTILVDRGQGPFRILYVAGRPNWEYKFLRRAIADEVEIELVGLVRIARKEPRFSFRGRAGESTNPLFRGFGNQGDATAEQYDEPVLVKLDTKDEAELRDGFPKDAATLFQYDAILLDDIEASFFTEDQKSLISQFVSLRGGGMIMLGGVDTFAAGGFDRTPIGEMLPVYLDPPMSSSPKSDYRLDLTREGWIQPWVRLESTREQEQQRLDSMPHFQTLNVTESIKPGASVLANVRAADDTVLPALVVQRFGKGRCAALLLGDLWRWKLGSPQRPEDLDKAWRQMMRWLVADVPQRAQISVTSSDTGGTQNTIQVTVYDAEYKPKLNADVQLTVTTPNGTEIELNTEQDLQMPGRYFTNFISREAGVYRVAAKVTQEESARAKPCETGWVADPAYEEFHSLVPNFNYLQHLASSTGGQVIEFEDFGNWIATINERDIPISETRTDPWWHRWQILIGVMALLVVEWGVRRKWGLA